MKPTKMTALKTNAKSTIIATARAIARETKEQAKKLWDTQTLNENYARALETLKDDVLADLSQWSNAKDNDAVSIETERAAVTAIYNGLKMIDYYLENARNMEQVSYSVVDLHELYKEENAYAMPPFQQKLFIKLIREKIRQENGQYDHMRGKLYLDDKDNAQKMKETARKMLRFIKETF